MQDPKTIAESLINKYGVGRVTPHNILNACGGCEKLYAAIANEIKTIKQSC